MVDTEMPHFWTFPSLVQSWHQVLLVRVQTQPLLPPQHPRPF